MIYIDSDYKCHSAAADGRRAFNVSFFDGKCDTLITGYRYVPDGESWTREDGTTFAGEMIAPWKDARLLSAVQAEYEIAQVTIAELDEAIIELEYQNILLEMGVNG